MKKISHTEVQMTGAERKNAQPALNADSFYEEGNQRLLERRIAAYKMAPDTFKEHELIEVD